jgi:ATP-binding cassette subfamily F protein 3
LQKPSLLLLDEPTNHLDLESRNWLENYLHDYPNAFILISHDRYFLDVTVNKTVELWNKRMHTYHGNYEKYVTQKEERRTQLMNAYKNQKDRIEALEAFINRFRAQATKAKQVQSRIKELEKIERIEVPEEEATIHFSIPQPPASGRTVIEVTDLKKVYPMPDGREKLIFEGLNFTIERGDRIALVGANGAGKSTLIRLLSGQEEPTSGTIREGHNVLTDFFAQDQYKVLDGNAEMLDDISGASPKVPVVELRSLLGCFMFSGEDVFKKLGVLSGGERNRYAMAKMLVSPSNFLLLDEPTNHLDLRAKDVLLDAIRNFTGTVLFVSHDRYFIDGLATRVFEVEDQRLHIYPGNYEDYLWRKQGGPEKVTAAITNTPVAVISAPVVVTNVVENKVAAVKKLNPIKLKLLENEVLAAENAIPEMEEKIAAAEAKLGVFTSAEELQKASADVERLRLELEQKVAKWEELGMQLEEQRA